MHERTRVLLWYWGRRGGGGRHTLELARTLARQPNLTTHLSLSRQSELFQATDALGLPGFPVDTFDDPLSAAWRTLGLMGLARRFQAYLDQQGIQVLLCTMGHVWNPWVARRCREPRRRYLFTLHDAQPHPGDRHPGWDWLLRATLHQADGILALSEHVRDLLIDHHGYPRERTWVIPHGPFVFPGGATEPDQPSRRPRHLLFFGRILPYKGLSLLLEAFSQIAEEQDLELTVAGRGELDPKARALLNHPRIHWHNRWIPEDEVARFFQAADVVVVPYLEASQSGVVASAHGMGLPVVVTPVGGLREQVRHGVTGLVAADTRPQSLAEAILALCGDPILYARCREGARQAGQMDAAWEAIGARLASLFEELRALPPHSG